MSENSRSPLDGINTSFSFYVEQRKAGESAHMVRGVPDYAFPLDYELRRRMKAIPGFERLCRNVLEMEETRMTQLMNYNALAVGPGQFPEIYEMGRDCARRLGIGIPNIYIVNDEVFNAQTVALDDVSPLIILYRPMVERLTPGELKCIIGHECGHVHNRHSLFVSLIDAVNPLNGSPKNIPALLLSEANRMLMNTWSRAMEVTADRAGMICADSVEDAISCNRKLVYNSLTDRDRTLDLEALRDQVEESMSNPAKMLLYAQTHPASARRIFMDIEFSECELFYRWRPELRKPETAVRTLEETNERCKKLVGLTETSLAQGR